MFIYFFHLFWFAFVVYVRTTKQGTKHKDSNSLWQIVFDKPAYGGDPVMWNSPFHLQHAATSQYLAVVEINGHYEVKTTSTPSPETLFSFSPLKTVIFFLLLIN